ncbi:MAG: chromosome segregation protein SMC [Candidatus Solibacter sp.]|nr:chromosome segregation protein SMC [Candidatus Solibacter sp.]
MSEPFRINRVVLKNYRSIAECDVELKNLTFLSGPNGAGKSNFLEALRFVADSLSSPLENAVNQRGGFGNICHRGKTAGDTLSIHLEFEAPCRFEGEYSFTLRAGRQGVVLILNEDCSIIETATGKRVRYSIAPGRPIEAREGIPPVIADDRLHLVHAGSVVRELRPLYDALSMMRFCSPEPRAIRVQKPAALGDQDTLTANADNIALVLGHLERHHPWVRNRIDEFLKAIVPSLTSVQVQGDDYRYLRFQFEFPEGGGVRVFNSENMSDGTLRALGVLTGMFQRPEHKSGLKAAVVGIEEPETALHPAAARVLFDALTEAAESRQVIVSTHSPDLLDSDDVEADSILAVQMGEDGATQIGPLDEAGRSVLRERLYTPGELMRINHLQPRREVSDSLKLSDRVDVELSPDEQ